LLSNVRKHVEENDDEDEGTKEANELLRKFTMADKKQYDLVRL
jgi:hypothetical protein